MGLMSSEVAERLERLRDLCVGMDTVPSHTVIDEIERILNDVKCDVHGCNKYATMMSPTDMCSDHWNAWMSFPEEDCTLAALLVVGWPQDS